MNVEEFLKFLDECGAEVAFDELAATWRVAVIAEWLQVGVKFLYLNDGLVVGITWVKYDWDDNVETSGNTVLYLPKSESDRVDDVVKFVVPLPEKCYEGD